MINIYLEVEDGKTFTTEDVDEATLYAERFVKKWLAKESIKRLGIKLRIRSTAGRKRVKTSSARSKKNSVWFGLRPITVAYLRDYKQTKSGVQSGDKFYKGAFAASVNGGQELIWKRKSERLKVGKRRKRSKNGTRRERPNPQIEVVREDLHDGTNQIINQLELEAQGVFKKAFLDAINNDY